jgi:NDP-sugar pyrophosphorylase family protein
MIFSAHRINKIEELKNINIKYGIECDLRNYNNKIILSHDPFINGEEFESFIKFFNHKFIIINIKTTGIANDILNILIKYNINNFFFLDLSIPEILSLKNQTSNIAIRLSEYEPIEQVLLFKDYAKWVWVDCFNGLFLNIDKYQILKSNNFKICLVSPELQNHNDNDNDNDNNNDNDIIKYKNILYNNNIFVDMICTKIYNINKWSYNNIQLIIPMSGIGERFVKNGYLDPKPIIKINDKYLIEYVLDIFPNVNDISVICNDLHLQTTNISNILKELNNNIKIYNITNHKKGPVYAISSIFNNINDDKEVIISYCDYGTSWNFNNFLEDTKKRDCDGAIVCYKGFHPHMLNNENYAFLKDDGDRYMLEIKEKESYTDNKMNEYCSNGTYYFKTGKIMKKYFQKLIDLDINIDNEFYVSLVYNLLVKDNLKVNIYEIDFMIQLGTPYDLENYKSWHNYFLNDKNRVSNYIYDYYTIIPLAGKGHRFATDGYDIPKPLLDIEGKPMIIKATECLPKSKNYTFIYLDEHKKNHKIDNILYNYYPDSIHYSIDNVTNGQASTVKIGLPNNLNESILISACDNGVCYDFDEFDKLIKDETIDIIIWAFKNNPTSKYNPNMYSWLDVDDNGFIKKVYTKNFIFDDPLKYNAIIGTMFYRKASYFLEGLLENYEKEIKTNNEYYVDDVINRNIEKGLKVKVFTVKNYLCWGMPNDYKTYNYWLKYFSIK